ncbi:MAG: hypothetical protein HYR88_04640 [Verrucomicrobia bacterium]|nr:hypothetical protein [Verrucomicrobiota bacterium]MBI3867087.1 hypothetical protein [Verrucomicrobiota bacterium]
MADPQFTPDANTGAPAKKAKGCWFYGCVTVAILAVLVGVGVVLTGFYVARKIKSAVAEYSQPEPLKLPELRLTPEQYTDVRKRSEAFKSSLATPSATPHELVLTADELNGLLSDVDRSGALSRSLRVKIEGDVISGMISIPLSRLGLPNGDGRFLNGEAGFRVSMAQGRLLVTLKDFRLKDKPLPPALLAGFQNLNLAEQYNNDPNAQSVLAKFETIEVRDGKLTIRTKSQ